MAATGIHWTFSPVLCIARDLRWGRVDETFGEDPYLIGELASAMVRGYQGDGLDDPTAILATAKHFAGYSETQGGRDASEADISPAQAALLVPAAVRAGGPRGLPHVHARLPVHGRRAHHRQRLAAQRRAAGEWGYTGTLVTDWDNVGRMVWEQQVCADYAAGGRGRRSGPATTWS